MDYEAIKEQQLQSKKELLGRIAELEAELAKMERYAQVKKAADEMKIVQMAFVDAGFTEDQAFQLIMTSLPIAAKMV